MILDTPRIDWEPGDDLPTILSRHARDNPHGVAMIQGDRKVTWLEFHEGVASVARALSSSGSRPGDKVAILGENSVEYAEVFIGALGAGACIVPLPTMASADSLSRMMIDSGSTSLFVSRNYRELGSQIAGEAVRRRVILDGEAPGFSPYSAFRQSGNGSSEAVPIGPEDLFDIIYSSGTTGIPKGIVHTHRVRKATYLGARSSYFAPESVNIIATPFYSNTTTVTWFITMARGGMNVILGKFSPEAFLEAVESRRGTHAMLVPVQYDRIFKSDRFSKTDCSSMAYFFSTSAPLNADVKRRVLDETRANLIEFYGLTEGGPVTVLDARANPGKLASVGLPVPGYEVRIVDEEGRDVPQGQAGEVVGRSPNMMSGYLNRPEETKAMLFRDASGTLYFRSGDLGRLDEDGFLYLLDRKKDVIISGGFNVYATDLESVLQTHPAIAEVTVIGIPSERWGETPIALVVLRAGSTATADELREYCNARVGKLQRLSDVELRTTLPRNAIGKVLKRELREPYWPKT